MSDEKHCLLKHLPESDSFTFHASAYFTLNELNKKIMKMKKDANKEDILEVVRKDLFQEKTKLNLMMLKQPENASPK